MTTISGKPPKLLTIHLDRKPYSIDHHSLSGAELRRLPKPPLGPEPDLFLEEHGDTEDSLVADDAQIRLKDGMHFYSKPRTGPWMIRIDRKRYDLERSPLTGAEIRQLPQPPLGPDVDLYLEEDRDVDDRLIADTDQIRIEDGLDFYSTPATITPGHV
ncbi:hypothetical protein [Patulibacter defluvii]|uniref:hypothetical protein n=1 Tax=Patulibacter defluvii TaxID=3095358 RepID=UPI002A74DF47|nr:hypothetical protein [Patulibacter sp. DM4]